MTETTKTETPTAAGCTQAHTGLTSRKDTWWIEPALVAIGFTLFIVYATYRVFENGHYEIGSEVVACNFDSMDTGWFQSHVLLLPESILPSLFLGSTGLLHWAYGRT